MDAFSNAGALQWGALITGLGGGLALFLFGMRMMTDALKVVAGGGMKSLLARLTANRYTAAAAGAIITAVIQSSSVTTVLAVGFISAGLMTFTQSLGVIIGANVGTTITAQIIAFKVTQYALPMIAAGFLTELIAKNNKIRQYGLMVMGLGLLFFGMDLMSDATRPLRSYAPFIGVMQNMTNPLFGILAGAAFTAVVQSSSATTGIVILLASQGFITLEAGIALVLGANIGTCVTVILSTIGKPRAALQTAAGHVVFNVLGVLLWFFFIPQFGEMVRWISPASPELSGLARTAAETPRQIANAHTLFNLANAAVFIWFIGPISRLVHRLVPEKKMVALPSRIEPEYLDEYYLQQADMAIDRTRLEIGRLGGVVKAMLADAHRLVTAGTREDLEKLNRMDENVDRLHGAIIRYLGELLTRDLVAPLPDRIYRLIAAANYLENIGDVIETVLVSEGTRRLENRIEVPSEVEGLLVPVHGRAVAAFDATMDALARQDAAAAEEVQEAKSEFKGNVEQCRSQLIRNLVGGPAENLPAFRLANEILSCYERIYALTRRVARLIEEAGSVSAEGISPAATV